MIVCKRCGNHNSADDEFCGSCGVFLEWEGERIVDDTAQPVAPQPLPPPGGIVSKIKHAVLGDGPSLPPPMSSSPPISGSSPSSTLAPPATGARTPGQQPLAAPTVDSAASALVAKQGPAPRPPTGDAPTGRAPSAEGPRPKPQIKQPPTKTINQGDLVCGTCGEGNSPDRMFCRRCGTSLAEIIPVKKKWWKRSGGHTHDAAAGGAPGGAPAGSRHAVPAGTRKSGRSSSGARKVKTGLFSGVNSIRRVLALLAIVGLGTAIAVPSLRSTITNKAGDIFNSAKNAVNPSYTQVSPDNTLSVSTSAAPGHEATLIADGGRNTYWVAASDSVDATVSVTFTPPTDIAKVLITPGDQEKPENFKAMPRPKDVFISALDASGTVLKSKQLNLEDKADPQEIEFEVSSVVSISLVVQSCYPDPALKVCAISEIEFFAEK